MPSKYGVETIGEQRDREKQKQKAIEVEGEAQRNRIIREEAAKFEAWKRERRESVQMFNNNRSLIRDIVNDVTGARGLRRNEISVHVDDTECSLITIDYNTKKGENPEASNAAFKIDLLLNEKLGVYCRQRDKDPEPYKGNDYKEDNVDAMERSRERSSGY